jgi:hypothetical protein
MSTSNAITMKRLLLDWFSSEPAEMAARLVTRPGAERPPLDQVLDLVRLTASQLSRAKIVLWRPETAELARTGHEAFVGTKVQVSNQEDQLWFDYCHDIDGYYAYEDRAELIAVPVALVSRAISTRSGSPALAFRQFFQRGTDPMLYWNSIGISEGRIVERIETAQYLSQIEFLKLPFVRCDASPLGRADRRRMKREGVDSSSVKIVYLRRLVDGDGSKQLCDQPGESGEAREWAYQWVVRGHWRKQWYPSVGEHRPVWIDSHMKGPEHLPVKVSEHTVMKVVR